MYIKSGKEERKIYILKVEGGKENMYMGSEEEGR